jgi:hypothetical protein
MRSLTLVNPPRATLECLAEKHVHHLSLELGPLSRDQPVSDRNRLSLQQKIQSLSCHSLKFQSWRGAMMFQDWIVDNSFLVSWLACRLPREMRSIEIETNDALGQIDHSKLQRLAQISKKNHPQVQWVFLS